MRWKILPIPEREAAARLVMRANALGSLYFFEKYVLQRTKLTDALHHPILTRLESDHLRYLLEMPRDHFKTVMVTEGRSMWRALPFDERDETFMRELGYDDVWIAWMKRIHDPSRRILTVSEILDNAVKIGYRIDWHFKENTRFRSLFPEVLPTAKEVWTNESKQQKCSTRGPQGEGTFDYLGVGGALQSRHYSDINEDDVIGKEALESETVMSKTVDYHRLLIGAFESYKVGAWTVVNNRWAPNDLSGWIRENQKEFEIESHSALGGCCDDHPPNLPIFPEEFTVETLAEIRRVQGPYLFSHQYLNLPVSAEECIFNKEWLRFYTPIQAPDRFDRHWLRHDVKDGETIADLNPNLLIRTMICDPNHAGEKGRCRHAIIVTGYNAETDRVYLLDVWARSLSYDDLTRQLYKMAATWNLHEFWLETVAAQKILKYHIEYRNKSIDLSKGERRLRVNELESSKAANAKRDRIESLEPVFRDGRLWVREDQSEFLEEYYAYPGGRTKDVLDALGYAPQTWNAIHAKEVLKLIAERKQRHLARRSITGY